MDTSSISSELVADIQFWVALIGLSGVLIGSAITVLGNIVIHWLQNRKKSQLDEARKEILITMLEDDRFPDKWRNLSTLSAVIGADDQTTMRLLIEVKARGSEKNDGKWGLIKHHPFNTVEL